MGTVYNKVINSVHDHTYYTMAIFHCKTVDICNTVHFYFKNTSFVVSFYCHQYTKMNAPLKSYVTREVMKNNEFKSDAFCLSKKTVFVCVFVCFCFALLQSNIRYHDDIFQT